MIEEDFEIPAGEHADYLLAGLARLIELRGVAAFVAAPLLLPEPRFFPDPVEARARGVSTLLRRLLAYARLEPHRVDVEVVGDVRAVVLESGSEQDISHAGAWFVSIDEGVYRFAVKESLLNDTEGLVGTLGHEVAHAYRDRHRLVTSDDALEEKLTDLTAVYLGFGVFSLQASFRFMTGHYDASGQQLLYERGGGGYLTPGELALLLAAQLVVRDPRDGGYARVVEHLAPNQASALAAAYRELADDRPALLDRLRLPPEREWPPVVALDAAIVPLSDARITIEDAPGDARRKEANERIGFRVAGSFAGFATPMAGGLGFALSVFAELETGWFWLVTLGCAGLGYVVGRGLRAPICSNCQRKVTPGAMICASCSVKLVGDVPHLEDRFAAEEAYRNAPVVAPRARR